MVLLTPGPCMTSEAVRQAAALPDLNHRDPDYADLIREVRTGLLRVYPQMGVEWHPYLLGGSGTAAVEAMVTSCVREGPVLILDNGYYSGRIGEILEIHRLPHTILKFDWERPIDLVAVERHLREKDFEAVLMTHHETTFGRLNPVGAVGEICASKGVRLLVDAMSSFGADDLDFGNVDAIAASANKCLHGIPGVAFVLCTDGMVEAMRDAPRRSYYLHLPMYEGENPPLTPPIPALQAFRQALRENPGAQTARKAVYETHIRILRDRLRARGFGFAVAADESSVTLLSPTLPQGWSYDRWFQANYDRGFVLYATKAAYRERFFQVSVMGEVTDRHLTDWLAVVDELLSDGAAV
ncbi:MAG: pyridoxal-phosphate-dependent aminotransferase family protein [Fimbriimonas sp.]